MLEGFKQFTFLQGLSSFCSRAWSFRTITCLFHSAMGLPFSSWVGIRESMSARFASNSASGAIPFSPFWKQIHTYYDITILPQLQINTFTSSQNKMAFANYFTFVHSDLNVNLPLHSWNTDHTHFWESWGQVLMKC